MYVPVNIPAITLASSPKDDSGEIIIQEIKIPNVVEKEPIKKRLTIGNPAFFIEFRLALKSK